MTDYLAVIGDREALGWVLRTGQMAFPSTTRSEVDALNRGDGLFIYTTRGCFKNPTRDRGRIIGHATVATDVRVLDEPVAFAGREFVRGCRITLENVAPIGEGAELAPLVPSLNSFPIVGAGWAMRLRRPLVRLDDADAVVLANALSEVTIETPRACDVDKYARWWDSSDGGGTQPVTARIPPRAHFGNR